MTPAGWTVGASSWPALDKHARDDWIQKLLLCCCHCSAGDAAEVTKESFGNSYSHACAVVTGIVQPSAPSIPQGSFLRLERPYAAVPDKLPLVLLISLLGCGRSCRVSSWTIQMLKRTLQLLYGGLLLLQGLLLGLHSGHQLLYALLQLLDLWRWLWWKSERCMRLSF